MVTVQACSRLHFGLLNPVGGEGANARRFGGVGLMIERPGLRLHVRASSSWSATGPIAERTLAFARRFTENTRREEGLDDGPPHSLHTEWVMPEHAGLGSGTQMGLAVAQALAVSRGLRCDLATLARRVGRGVRSALGTHGFEQGGFLVEAGKRASDRLAPLVARLTFPESWRLVLALPTTAEGAAGLHGMREVEAFTRLAAETRQTDTLCRLVLLDLLPALVERDLDSFGEALYEFNARVGEAFAPVQGGVYASPRVAELVAFLRSLGVRGVGQSSWGPTVFAVVADEDHGRHLAARLRQQFALNDEAVLVTSACNHGASVTSESSPAPPG
jgi:beta-RFAP synthase